MSVRIAFFVLWIETEAQRHWCSSWELDLDLPELGYIEAMSVGRVF